MLWEQIIMPLTNDPLHFLTVCYTNALCEDIDVKMSLYCALKKTIFGLWHQVVC